MRLFRVSFLLLALLAPARAMAFPNLEGHITDPQHRLSQGDRDRLVKKIEDIMQNTHIDMPFWISDVAPNEATRQAEEAYRRWGIAHEWDNGVFFIFPTSGPVQIVLDHAKPALTPDELKRVVGADNPSVDYARRIELLSEAADQVLRPKARGVRPPGTVHAEQGRYYLLGALLVALAAIAASVRWREPAEA